MLTRGVLLEDRIGCVHKGYDYLQPAGLGKAWETTAMMHDDQSSYRTYNWPTALSGARTERDFCLLRSLGWQQSSIDWTLSPLIRQIW